MRLAMRRVAVFVLGAGILGSSLGCEVEDCEVGEEKTDGICAKSLKTFNSAPVTETVAYTAGGGVKVDGANGDIDIVAGNPGVVEVTFKPFTSRAYDTPQSEVEAELASINLTADADGSGGVLIKVDRPSGSNGYLGAEVVVALPPEMNGTLEVLPNNGDLDVEYTAAATDIVLNNGEVSDIEAVITAVPLNASVTTDGGSVDLQLPLGKYNVQALARTESGTEGLVTVESNDSCTVNTASPGAVTVSCGGATAADPTFYAEATGLDPQVVLGFY